MSSPEFITFFQRFGVDLDNLPKDFNYSTHVLGENVRTFPFQVARILRPPRGPTSFQDGLIGVIVPHIVDDDIGQMFSAITDQPLSSGSIDMRTGERREHTADTLYVNAEGFINSALLACYYYLNKGQEEVAYKLMQYIDQILPFVGFSQTWTLTPMDSSKPFAQIGDITNPSQLLDPYSYQEAIFPDSMPPHVRLS